MSKNVRTQEKSLMAQNSPVGLKPKPPCTAGPWRRVAIDNVEDFIPRNAPNEVLGKRELINRGRVKNLLPKSVTVSREGTTIFFSTLVCPEKTTHSALQLVNVFHLASAGLQWICDTRER